MIGRTEKKHCRAVLSFASLLLFLCSLFSSQVSAEDALDSASAADKNRPVIRVAYPIQPGLTERDEDGHYSGYTYEYLMEIAQYAGWHYEFVSVDGDINEQLSTLMGMLQNGEVDLMGGMVYNDALGEIYDYPSINYGTSCYTLSVQD